MKGQVRLLAVTALVVAGAVATPALCAPVQSVVPGLPQSGQPGGDELPINVNADQLEWHQNEKAYVARGHATATRGDVTLSGDVLTAYYRDRPQGGTEIFRLAAEGNVEVQRPTQQVFGDKGVYDVDKKVAVMTGNHLRLITPTDVVTARDTLEYWQDQRLAVARGDAVDVREQNRVSADTLVGLFENGPNNALVMTRVDADGNVVITTPTDIAQGRQGVYNVATRIAVLTGDVKLTRGENQVDGDIAEVDMNTGISRVLNSKTAEGTQKRVHGLFIPGQDAGAGLAPPGGAPARLPAAGQGVTQQ